MEAAPATNGVRRTVRLAAALVAGQIVLVAVIGWVTLGRTGGHSAGGVPAVDRLAARPVVPAPVVPPPAPPAGRTAGSTGPAPAPTAPARHRARRTAPTPAGASTRPPAEPNPPPVALTSFGLLTLVPSVAATPSSALVPPLAMAPSTAPAPSTTPAPSAPDPVLAGQPCTRRYELTRADDGRSVQCLPDRRHRLRWKIV